MGLGGKGDLAQAATCTTRHLCGMTLRYGWVAMAPGDLGLSHPSDLPDPALPKAGDSSDLILS